MSAKDERRFGTELPTAIFPDAEQVDLDTIIGIDILVKDFREMMGDNGPYVIINFERSDGPEDLSTACGGAIVVRKCLEAKSKGLLPLVGAITKVPSKIKGHSDYYDLN